MLVDLFASRPFAVLGSAVLSLSLIACPAQQPKTEGGSESASAEATVEVQTIQTTQGAETAEAPAAETATPPKKKRRRSRKKPAVEQAAAEQPAETEAPAEAK